MKARAILLLVLVTFIAGCAGAGPSSATHGTRSRCGASATDDQRPLFFVFCVETP